MLNSLKTFYYGIAAFLGIGYLLVIGKPILIPLLFAVLIWIIIKGIREKLDAITFLRKLPRSIKNTVISLLLLSVFGLLIQLININIQSISNSYSLYQKNFLHIIERINKQFNIDLYTLTQNKIQTIDFSNYFSSLFTSITDIVGNTLIIFFYLLFLLLEEINFANKTSILFPEKEQFNRVNILLHQIEDTITSYIGLKTLVSLVTSICSFICLKWIGVDAAVFWSVLIFILNFIPTIGSLIATFFPALFCLLQFGDFYNASIVLLVVGSIQVIVGNVVEPRVMGNSLNISSLVAFISLSIWGAIWGITGMLLSIPITVIGIIIFAQFPKTKWIAILLSEKGKI
jgi:AI-2 transport protein TqsA